MLLRDVPQPLRLGEAGKLLQGLVLDLADALAGDVEGAPDLVQGARVLAAEARSPGRRETESALSLAERMPRLILEARRVSTTLAHGLHGRRRADGRPAKPDLCSEWPPKDKGLHPGCVFAPGARRVRRRA